MRHYSVAAGLALAVAFASVGSAAHNAFPGRNGRIAFTSVRAHGGSELWSVKADGTGLARLTAHSPVMNGATPPAWAPDGRSIAFDSSEGVLVVDVQTGRVRRPRTPIVTTGDGLSWSPDGRRFVVRGAGGSLWIARRDGSGRRRLTSGHDDVLPAWSPDGKRVAFIRRRMVGEPEYRDDSQVAIVRADGGGLHTIGRGDSASWSPDGKRLVVRVSAAAASLLLMSLVVVSADGQVRSSLLIDPNCWLGSPAWSSTGTIAFAADCGQDSGELQAIEADGSRRRTLIKDFFRPGYSDPAPYWSPDGTRLAYADESGMLRLASADGSGVRDVFRAPPGSDSWPAWSPDGRRLVAVFSKTPPARANPELIESPVLEDFGPLRTPAWSPDGRHLVGIECEEDCEWLVVVDLATGDGQTIAEHHGAVFPDAPAWSPDGRWIAFGRRSGEGKSATASILFYDVVKRTVVGEEGRLAGDHPSWAPGGKRLAVDTYLDYLHPERSSVFTARRDGSQRRRIARNASQPAWSPDGRKIVFVRIVGRANSELFVMNADGSHQRRLTFNPGPDVEPDWQPLPR